MATSYCAGVLIRYEPDADELRRAQIDQVSDVAVSSEAVWVNHGSNATSPDAG